MSQVPEQLQNAIATRYQLERQIGRGGMATVYLGRDLKHDRPVAVKVLLPALGALLGVERFLREIKLVARLQHPHILPLYDSGEADGMVYYVMPYVADDSLRDRLRHERRMHLHDALRLSRDVADALYYAHGNGIVHRDIKPENILLSGTHALVADFGIARAVHAAGGEQWETLTEGGVALGTPAYMSPEQTVGESNVDGRSDIYSLGCVMYEMLTGAPPFTGPDGALLLAKRFTDPPPWLRAVRDDVPLAVESAIRKALARDPTDRFANALELVHAIGEERDASVRTVTSHALHARRPRRASVAATAGIGIAAALGALSVVRHRLPWRASAPAHTAAIAAAAHTEAVAAPRDSMSVPRPAKPLVIAPDTHEAAKPPSVTSQPPPSPRLRRIPHRETPLPVPRPDTVAVSRPDTVLGSLRTAATQMRSRALASGASLSELAAGDSLFTTSYAEIAAGHRAEAIALLSNAAGAWAAAMRAARPAPTTDSTATDSSAAGSARARPAPAAPRSVATRPPAAESAPPRVTDSAATRAVAPDPRPEIDALVGRYARAIEARSVAAIGELYPTITTAQRHDWEQFFQAVRDITVRLTVTRLDVEGGSADAQVEGVYEYANTSTHRMEQHPVRFHASLRRDAAGWRVRAIE